jgi:hypothetical protein
MLHEVTYFTGILDPVVFLITSRQVLESNHNLGYVSFSLENPFLTVLLLCDIMKYMSGKVLFKLTQKVADAFYHDAFFIDSVI